tara:strand:- start:326 stop:682 length:357 start_codon:yes stop_codon:yes gene_type:complete
MSKNETTTANLKGNRPMTNTTKTRKAKLLKAIREATYVEVMISGDIEMTVDITKTVANGIIKGEDENENLDDWSIIRWEDGGIKLYHSAGVAQDEAEWIAEGCKHVNVDLEHYVGELA